MARDLVYLLDPVEFAVSIGFTPDPWQARVLRSNAQQLLLNCSRQSGKSQTSAVLALHHALYHRNALVLLISPSQRQSSELFRKVKDLMAKLTDVPALTEDNKLSARFETGSRIVSLPSTEATIRGFSAATLVIEDEASRVPDELYYAVRPMLAVSGGRIVLMSTPFGKRGHFFEAWAHGGDAWERVRVTAPECPRISKEFLQAERRTLGEWWFEQEYLCEFRERMDQVFAYDLVRAAENDSIEPLAL